MKTDLVPKALKNWFVIHFAVDLLFAIPMMLAPVATLSLFGWQEVDPFTTRLVAAALFGIGIESYLGRNAGVESYLGMLNSKIIWSSAAIVGMAWSLLEGSPPPGWAILLIFVAFNGLWVYWRRQLSHQT